MKIALSLALATLFFVGCGDSNSHKAQEHTETQKEASSTTTLAHDVVKAAMNHDSVKQIKESVEKKVQEVTQQATQKAQEALTKTTEAATSAVAAATTATEAATTKAAATKTGTQLFVACAGCHGQNAEKKALGKSQVIKGWDAAKIETALKGYKDGSYGGSMKAVMKGQAAKLSDAEIKELAEHISKL